MITKYNVGDTIMMPVKVKAIIAEEGEPVKYHLEAAIDEQKWGSIIVHGLLVDEDKLDKTDGVPAEEYEKRVIELQNVIEQYRDMYRAEHHKVIKIQNMLEELKKKGEAE